MHMADALVAPAVGAAMYAVSTAAAGFSIKKVRLEYEPRKIPVMGVMGAFVFAAQMINFAIPGTGSSGHLCGGLLLGAILGPWAGFLTMIGVLTIQCLMFADGGLLALGCNIWNMAFYGCFVGGFLIWKPIVGRGMSKRRITAASVAACVLTLQMGAFSVVLETLLSDVTELPFSIFVSVMQPIHLAIGLAEGVVTAAVLCFIYEARPELLWTGRDAARAGNTGSEGGWTEEPEKEGRFSFRKTLLILAVAAAVLAGVVSLYASSLPDGLEWSIEKVAGTAELEAGGGVYETAEKIQDSTAILPDYRFSSGDTAAGTAVSGLAGGAAVIFVCVAACYVFKLFTRKKAR